ncbi:MAG: methyltransferase [Rhodoblastus sp.]|nr:methyltransferase [Rhodoblastus sp.]
MSEASDINLDRAAFIRANTRLLAVPHAPEISLQLADEATALWEKTEEELGEIGLPPPFWAFAWAGGQALARYILDQPEIVAGKRVLDFASGSGLVAIAAAKAGAREVEASEIDVFAVEAIAINARANGVSINPRLDDVIGREAGWDVILAGDVSYERDMAQRVTDWLAGLAARGATVLVGDPGRSYLARERLEAVAEYRVPVTRALEDSEIKKTSVWRFRRDHG